MPFALVHLQELHPIQIPTKSQPHLIQSSSHSATTTTQDHESDVPHHPLDPLTIQEINAAHSILHSYPPFSSSTSSLAIHSLSLDEPPKPTVLNWNPDDTLPPRHAAVVASFYGNPYILSVNLSSRIITGHPVPTSGFPTIAVDDMTSSIWAPHANPAFNRSVLA